MTKPATLEAWYAALTVGGRMSPERSRAQEKRYYGDPAKSVRFGKRKEAEVERISDREKADTLLIEWYRWSKQWRPNLGAPKISPSCRGYRGDEKHNEEGDGYDSVHQKEMKAVDFCVGSIAVPMQQAIGTEMRNREAKARVWRDPGNRTFAAALDAVLPHMRKHEDLWALF